jgi:hypothetical protein
MASLRTITIRYVDASLTAREITNIDTVDVCNMSGLIAGIVQSTNANVVDLTAAADGRFDAVHETLLDFICRDYEYPIQITSGNLAAFVKGIDWLCPTPRFFEYMDRVFAAFVRSPSSLNRWSDRAWAQSVMDTLVDIMVELAPYFSHLPKTVHAFKTVCVARYVHIDFMFGANSDVKRILDEVVITVVRQNSETSGEPINFRTQRYSGVHFYSMTFTLDHGAVITCPYRIYT